MKALWKTLPPGMLFFTKLRKARYYKELCIAKAAKARLEENRNLESPLNFGKSKLHSDTQNEVNKVVIKDCQAQLQVLLDRKEDGHRIRFGTKWMEFGDRMNKLFFSSFKEHPIGGLITKLYNEDEIVVSSRANLARIWSSFYPKLYSPPEADGQREDCIIATPSVSK